MRYTSNEKLDIDRLKEYVKEKGVSDKAKKWIGFLLVAAKIVASDPVTIEDLNIVESGQPIKIVEYLDPVVTVDSMKSEYKSLLDNSTLPAVYKNRMIKSIEENFKTVVYVDALAENYYAGGRYWPDEQKIQLDDVAGVDTRIHEMFHAASTIRNSGEVISVGTLALRKGEIDYLDFKSVISEGYQWNGKGFTEGITEYLADRIVSENGIKPEDTGYSSLVAITQDIITLYGEDAVLDAYLGEPEKLEELMAKDGVSYTRFLELMDKQYTIEFKERINDVNGEIKKTYERIGELLNDIRQKHIEREPNIVLPLLEWEKEFMNSGTIVDYNKVASLVESSGIDKDLSWMYNDAYKWAFEGAHDESIRRFMAEDGVDWDRFYKKLEEYVKLQEYGEKNTDYEEIEDKKRELFLDIGKDIEKAKQSHKSPYINIAESKWINYYIDELEGDINDIALISTAPQNSLNEFISDEMIREVSEKLDNELSDSNFEIEDKPKNKLIEWFKNLKDKFAGIFKKSDEVRLLNSGEEKMESNVSKQNEFLEGIKIDEAEMIYRPITKENEKEKNEFLR